jgi:hypothetical protein
MIRKLALTVIARRRDRGSQDTVRQIQKKREQLDGMLRSGQHDALRIGTLNIEI